MKKLYILLMACMAIFSHQAAAQWLRIITAEQSSPLGRVQVVTPTVAYASNSYGRYLFRTADGGNTWAYTTGEIAGTYPAGFHFFNADTGFVAGDKGYLYKTVNGGSSYTRIARPYQHYKDITFINNSTGFITGNGRVNVQPADSAFVLKTTDGGNTWTYTSLGHTDQMASIAFYDANNGCATSLMGGIYVTTDGGSTWVQKRTAGTNTVNDIVMPLANVIYATGYNTFIQSLDGGNTWSNVNTGQGNFTTYSGMYFSDTANGFVAFSGGLLKKENSVWSRYSNINTSLLHVHFLNVNSGIATGNDGFIYKYVGNTPVLLVGNPPAGKVLFRKQNYSISWSSNAIDTVKIEYRLSPSASWQLVSAKEAASKGFVNWTVPDVEASEVSVRITDVTNSANTAKTPDNISITLERNINITSPGKYSANLVAGKKLRIGWTSLNIDTVSISYRMNAGQPWSLIAPKVAAFNGSYLWTLPGTETRNLQVKIVSATDARYADSSQSGKLRPVAIHLNDPAWTLQNPRPFLGSFKDAQLIDANTVYALADPNVFVKSTDKGASWSIVKNIPADGEAFKGMHFLNANLGYVLMGDEYGSNLYKTTDGGLNWIITYEGLPGTMRSVQFATADSGWVWGGDFNGAGIMHTANGGLTFTQQQAKVTKQIKDLFVITSTNAWMVSEDGFLRKTNNAGQTWDSVMKISYMLNDIHFIGNTGWAVGGDFSNGRVLITTDNGATWTIKNTTGAGIDAIAMKDANTGYIIATSGSSSSFFKKTTDGGNTWTNINAWVNPTGYLPFASKLLLTSTDAGIGFKKESYNTDAAYSFVVSGTNVSSWSPVSSEVFKNANLSVYGLNAGITMLDSTTGYAMSRHLLKTTNGGANWNIASTTEFFTNTSHMQFIGKDTGFVCGEKSGSKGIFRTTNGGTSWSLMRSTGSAAPFRIHFADKLSGFALAGQFDSLYKTNDGGLTWTGVSRPFSTNQGLYFMDANKGYVFGTSLYETTNGGTTWKLINLNMDAGAYLTRIRFFDANTGYAVGYYGVLPNDGLCAYIFKTTNGGASWTRQICPSIGGDLLRDVCFIDANNGFASGEGMIYQTADGGANWHISALPIPNGNVTYSISAMAFTDARNGWAVVGNNQSNIIMKCTFKTPVVGPPVPAITLITPNGGENFTAGSQQSISWSSANIDSVKIQYRTSSAGSWMNIATVSSVSNQYTWTVPVTATTNASVKVSASNSAQVADSSNAVFSIIIPTNPALTLTAPNGGESFTVGSTRQITWTAVNIDSIDIAYRISPTAAWLPVKRVVASAASYTWTIPNAPSTTVRVRISSANNSALSDSSNTDFEIVSPSNPTLSLQSPNGGEIWLTGSTQSISWVSALVDSVVIEYTTGSTYYPVATVSASNGSYSWIVPDSPSVNCKVRISNKQNTLSDTSNADFEIRLASGIDELEASTGFQLYPNPFTSMFNIELRLQAGDELAVLVYDVCGRLVSTHVTTAISGTNSLVIDDIQEPGIYFARVTVNGKQLVKKIVKY